MTHYFDTPKFCVALNAKCGSSSLARAIIRQFRYSAVALLPPDPPEA